LIDIAYQVSAGVDGLQIAKLAVHGPRGVFELVLVIGWIEQGDLERPERPTVGGVGLIVEHALRIHVLIGLRDQHIPVVIIDSALAGQAGKDYVSFIATDNHKGGQIAGQKLADLLGGKGKVVLLRYGEGSASTLEREAGFLDIMNKNPGIQILVQNRYAGPTIGDAKDTAMQMSDDLQAADGIFASNESACAGMLLALRQLGLAGKVKFVGFDTDTMLIGALKTGQIQGLVAQNPSKMAYLGVEQAINALKGQPVTEKMDSGCALITPENLTDPAMQEYLEVK